MGLFGGNTAGTQSGYLSALLQAQGAAQAQDALSRNYGEAKKAYDTNYYDPYTAAGGNALSMYQNALGLGGPEGTAAAQNAFKVSPGYEWQLGQGIQALDRSAAGKGLFGSGNNAIALTQYGQGLANQEYQNWLNSLSGLTNTGLTSAAGQTARQGQIAGLSTGLGNALAGIYTGLGQNAGKSISEGIQTDAANNAQGTSNIFNALLGGANLGLKAYYGPAAFTKTG